ncbi:hypothetical protein [Jannaschia sp. W003]|uniref:hypothetical protein n=1 Tax=Jannaschia sp. W003 TaxID=2867012 RepID=UPI0021A559C7|nr:hypothetical protein [Jannaschia sp. W003]UWQ22156.1 hypothetical protein K3554_03745 [Jannaschia sp. W003]
MTKLLAISSAALLAFAPVMASAESPLFLNSTKSSGNLSAPVVEDVVIVPEVMPARGISPLLLAGLGLAAVAGIAALADDDDDATTSTQ